MAGIYRTRPGADAIAPAEDVPAVAIADTVWMSKGVSNSYSIATNDGRVVVNTGLHVEGPLHRKAFDASCPGPTRSIVITQGHADHFGGVKSLRDEGTDVVMQADNQVWRDDFARLTAFRMRNAAFGFGHISAAIAERISILPPEEWMLTFPEPTMTFRDRLELTVGGRRLDVIATPGGETTDACIVWLPDERTVFTGNLFGPLFGHVPNLVTIRGDRYRDAVQYVAAADIVLALGADVLVTGHFDPIVGAEVIAEEVAALRDATQWVHDRTVEGMDAGADVHTLMREIHVPTDLDVGEGYGKTSWNVRAIWETYAGWFHHRSTTELFHVPARAVAVDLVSAAGADAIIDAARARIAAGEYLEAIHLIEVVLEVDGNHTAARAVGAEAHDRLGAQSTNFWETAWLRHTAAQLRGDE